MTRKIAFALTALVLTLVTGVTAALAGRAARRPTRRDVHLDPDRRHLAAVGLASAYASVARGADAYFKYVNARGGVNGRKIVDTNVDDAVQPGADGAGDAAARGAGQGLRDVQHARHRAEPRRCGTT